MTQSKSASPALERENPVITGPIWKQLLTFFFPILLGSFFQQMYNTVDAIIVGQFVGKAALAAVGGSTSVLISFLVNLFTGISSGATVIIAQQFGAQNEEGVKKSVHTSMALTIIAGIAITIIGFALSKPALLLMGTPDDILGHATTYMRIYFLGSLASFVYNIGSGILRAVGDNRRPLYFLIAACMTNIVLDVVLVLGLHMGVAGAPLATILSQLVAAILVIWVLVKTDLPIRINFKEITIIKEHLQSVLRVGIPSGLQSNMYTISNIALQACINSFGTNSVAAWTAYGKVDSFFWMIIGAFGISITTFVGQNYGAGQYERVRKAVKTCLIMTFSASAFIGAFFCLFAQPLLSVFTSDPDVLAIGMRILYMTAPTYVTFVCIEILSGTIRGCGNSLPPMLLTCCGVCIFRVAWVFLLNPIWHSLDMVIVSYPVSWTLTSILFVIYYRKFNWMRR